MYSYTMLNGFVLKAAKEKFSREGTKAQTDI
jgi:hypothetical protein